MHQISETAIGMLKGITLRRFACTVLKPKANRILKHVQMCAYLTVLYVESFQMRDATCPLCGTFCSMLERLQMYDATYLL